MKIELHLYATLRQYEPEGHQGVLEIEDGTTVEDLLVTMGVPLEQAKLVYVNGRRVNLDYTFKDGDRVGIFPPVAGG